MPDESISYLRSLRYILPDKDLGTLSAILLTNLITRHKDSLGEPFKFCPMSDLGFCEFEEKTALEGLVGSSGSDFLVWSWNDQKGNTWYDLDTGRINDLLRDLYDKPEVLI